MILPRHTIPFSVLSLVIVAAVGCISGCSGGSESPLPAADGNAASEVGVDFSLSSSYAATGNATYSGGHSGIFSITRASQASNAPTNWTISPKSGSFSNAQGDSTTYTPPAVGALELPQKTTITATVGTFKHDYPIAVFPTIWRSPSAGNWGTLTISGAAKPNTFPTSFAPNDYPVHDPVPNFDMYSWTALLPSLQAAGPGNLIAGQYDPTAGKGVFIGVTLMGILGWEVRVRADDQNVASPLFTGDFFCNGSCPGMNVAVNGSNMEFTNVRVPLDQGGEIVLDGTLAINELGAQPGTTRTSQQLQQCPKTWAGQTGLAALANLACVDGTYAGINPSGNGQCSVTIDSTAKMVTFTSEGTTETMPIPNNSSTGTVAFAFNPRETGSSTSPFRDQYAVAMNTLPQSKVVAGSVQRLLFTFGFKPSQSVVVSTFAYELDFSYTKAASPTAQPSVAKHCRINLPT